MSLTPSTSPRSVMPLPTSTNTPQHAACHTTALAISARKPVNAFAHMPHTAASPNILRQSRQPDLVDIINVRTSVLRSPRRHVRLCRGILSISYLDTLGRPTRCLRSAYMCDATTVSRHRSKPHITVCFADHFAVTLVFSRRRHAAANHWYKALSRSASIKFDAHYDLGAVIGSGHYGTVYEAVDKKSGMMAAVKYIIKPQDDVRRAHADRETELARYLSHPNLVKVYDVYEEPHANYIVMEYLRGGNLCEFWRAGRNRCSEKNAVRIARQLLSVVQYLHIHDIVHRDINPENILLDDHGSIRLIDLGLAGRVPPGGNGSYCFASLRGSSEFCAPEIIQGTPHGKPVDIFACGVLIFQAMTGCIPYAGSTDDDVLENIVMGRIDECPTKWGTTSEEGQQFIRCLLQRDQDRRLTAIEVNRHPWLGMSGDRKRVTGLARVRHIKAHSAGATTGAGIRVVCRVDDRLERNLRKFRTQPG